MNEDRVLDGLAGPNLPEVGLLDRTPPTARGAEVCTSSDLLDLTALGRQEPWEAPKVRTTGLAIQAGSQTMPYPDEYFTP